MSDRDFQLTLCCNQTPEIMPYNRQGGFQVECWTCHKTGPVKYSWTAQVAKRHAVEAWNEQEKV